MNGKSTFLVTLLTGVLLAALAFGAGALDPGAGVLVGVLSSLVWSAYLVALLYVAGGMITDRVDEGRAATSIVLALLLTPVVYAAPTFALLGSLASTFGDSFGPGYYGL